MFSLCVTLMFSVRLEIVITGVGMNSLCNFTKYYSCEISLNVNFNELGVKLLGKEYSIRCSKNQWHSIKNVVENYGSKIVCILFGPPCIGIY